MLDDRVVFTDRLPKHHGWELRQIRWGIKQYVVYFRTWAGSWWHTHTVMCDFYFWK